MTPPFFEQLSAAPELATLAFLEIAASMAILTLGAEYPELASDTSTGASPTFVPRSSASISLALSTSRSLAIGVPSPSDANAKRASFFPSDS